MIEFTVLGEPKAQGSKRAFALKKGGQYTGRVAVTEQLGEPLKLWRSRLAEAVAQNAPPDGPLAGAVSVVIAFHLRRPQKPKHELPIGRVGDIDKLCRAVLDELTGVIVSDDCQVTSLTATKDYGTPGAQIQVCPNHSSTTEAE